MEFQDLVQRAMQIRKQYTELERAQYGRAWTSEEVMLGFVGDVGDLAKLVMARNGIRNIADAEEKLEHELADCLWSVLVLSQLFDIDLERTFLKTMNDLEKQIASHT